MAACMLQGTWVGEEARARNLVFFRVKWLGQLVCAAGAAGVVSIVIGSSFVFCSAWMQIAL